MRIKASRLARFFLSYKDSLVKDSLIGIVAISQKGVWMMNYFYPHAMAQRVYQITPQLLKSWGVKGLILDIDNTLTTHDNPIPNAGVSAWLEQNRREGIAMIVLSNNKPERVEPFAKILGLDYISNGAKPLKKGYQRCAQALNIPCEQLCMVGDQLFTDILGGNWKRGLTSVLVTPWEPETGGFLAVKRRWEAPILKRYFAGRKEE